MAITRPVTKTVISIPNWGVPITDEVNRLSAWQLANPKVGWGRMAHAIQTAAQNGIGALTDLTGVTITFTAIAGRYYRIVVAGLMIYANNAGIADLGIFDGSNTRYMNINNNISAAGFVGGLGSLETYPLALAAGSWTFKARLSINTGTVNTSPSSVSPIMIAAYDVGPTS